MRALVQRVEHASVEVNKEIVGKIFKGLLVFLGVGREDTEEDIDYMVRKVTGLRIFNDQDGRMNLSVKDIEGEILVVSQFTLYGDVKKGYRPSFTDSKEPEEAERYYEIFKEKCGEFVNVQSGVFGADMNVELLNQGPVTILIESK